MTFSFDQFLKAVAEQLELDWRKYRRRAARRHVEERLKELGLQDFSSYLDYLRDEPDEARRLPDIMRVTVSRFFRDRDCWRDLADVVLPQLPAGKKAGRQKSGQAYGQAREQAGGQAEEVGQPLRVLSIGCCNGEEPYSLAITLLSLSQNAQLGNYAQAKILAIDFDEKVLARARCGCYGKGSLREVPEEILTRFFHPEKDLMCVDEHVKGLVQFERHSFVEDPLLEGLDLVLCRYLAFTYYTGRRRRRAAERLYELLRPGGALMIGCKEALGPGEADLFEPWPGTSAIFRRC